MIYSAERVGKLLGVPSNKTPPPPQTQTTMNSIIVWVDIFSIRDVRNTNAQRVLTSRTSLYDSLTLDAQAAYWEIFFPVALGGNVQDAAKVMEDNNLKPTPLIVDTIAWCVHKLATGLNLYTMINRTACEGYYGEYILLTADSQLDFGICPGIDDNYIQTDMGTTACRQIV